MKAVLSFIECNDNEHDPLSGWFYVLRIKKGRVSPAFFLVEIFKIIQLQFSW